MQDHHFKQEEGTFACGECSIRSILSMYGMQLKERLNTEDGVEMDRIKKYLAQYGIHTHSKHITWEKLKRRSIAYYDEEDHWVVIEKIDKKNNKVYINDSDKDCGEWVNREQFEKLWLPKNSNAGHVIECRRMRKK
jgi:ABC-type bacteriocin/lantibiotic exporter with double-glycine peptidase domain